MYRFVSRPITGGGGGGGLYNRKFTVSPTTVEILQQLLNTSAKAVLNQFDPCINKTLSSEYTYMQNN